jgi:hypothetical protein
MAYFKVMSWHLPVEAEENYKNLMIVSNLAEIQMKYFLNTNLECYHSSNLFIATHN